MSPPPSVGGSPPAYLSDVALGRKRPLLALQARPEAHGARRPGYGSKPVATGSCAGITPGGPLAGRDDAPFPADAAGQEAQVGLWAFLPERRAGDSQVIPERRAGDSQLIPAGAVHSRTVQVRVGIVVRIVLALRLRGPAAARARRVVTSVLPRC